MPYLMWIFILPFLSAFALFCLKRVSTRSAKRCAFLLSLMPLLLLAYAYKNLIGMDAAYPWIPALGINFHLAVDGISLVFLWLTAIVIPVTILMENSPNMPKGYIYYGLSLMLQGLLFAFFMARDLFMFVFFWEAMLIPLFFIMQYWGGPERRTAAFTFIIYMFAGSIFMIAAILALYLQLGTFDVQQIAGKAEALPYASLIFAIFLLAFAVKTPLFPFHGWLPEAYYQAPFGGAVQLSALLSKAGIYGVAFIGIQLFPNLMKEWSLPLLSLAIAGVIYAALAAWMQSDYKRLIAYTSLSHVNFVLAGLFLVNGIGVKGAIFQAFNHGITITALFLTASWFQNKIHTTAIGPYSGLAKYFPRLCWTAFFFVLATVALPGTNNFIGELLILLGVFSKHPWLAVALTFNVVLVVVYMLRWVQKMYFGIPSPRQEEWRDIGLKDLGLALPLVVITLWLGLYPMPVLQEIPSSPVLSAAQATNEDHR